MANRSPPAWHELKCDGVGQVIAESRPWVRLGRRVEVAQEAAESSQRGHRLVLGRQKVLVWARRAQTRPQNVAELRVDLTSRMPSVCVAGNGTAEPGGYRDL